MQAHHLANNDQRRRRELRGNFLRIYQRQPNGEWRMTRDMFNSDGGQ